jgi:predicted HAD superfamily hydrolase
MNRVYSFDVYDTLLTRPLLRPTDLFYVVGTMLESKNSDYSPTAYKIARQQAEKLARKSKKPRDDCNFADIFTNFEELIKWDISKVAAMNAELELERNMVRPVVSNVKTVRKLAASGEKVIFLSDMYLPGDFIWELICSHIVSCKRDSVLVSGDLGFAKYSGRLFKHVLDLYDITPKQLQHFGDNEHSDFRVPRKLGIDAHIYKDSRSNRYESLPRPQEKQPFWLSNSIGISKACRLATANNNATISKIACNVVGPILTAFVKWVLNNARANGIERLYFVSRDGQIFQKIAAVIRDDDDPECRYLYGSRQAWFLPSVFEPTSESLEWAWITGMSRTGNDILRRLDIDTRETYAILERNGLKKDDLDQSFNDVDFEQFKKIILNPLISDFIIERARHQRTITQSYLRQEGLLDSINWAIVDVGWTLKCQQSLRLILEDAGYNEKVCGYYFGVVNDHVPIDKCGQCNPFVTPPGSDLESRFNAKWFFKLSTILLIEHLFTIADHPTVSKYREMNGRFEPIYKYEVQNEKVIALGREMHEAIIHYAKEINLHSSIDAGSKTFSEYAFLQMRKFCMKPDFDDVFGIAWLPTNKDQSHHVKHTSKLASPLQLTDLWEIVCHSLLSRHENFFKPHFSWTEGSLALSKKHIQWLFILLFEINSSFAKFKKMLF